MNTRKCIPLCTTRITRGDTDSLRPCARSYTGKNINNTLTRLRYAAHSVHSSPCQIANHLCAEHATKMGDAEKLWKLSEELVKGTFAP
jgi:hypothetical protein